MVSGTYFPAMGVGAALGRTFSPDDDRTPGGHPIVVLSYNFWETQFNKDPQVLGKKVWAGAVPMTIVGVIQPGFDGIDMGNTAQIFVPLVMQPELMPFTKSNGRTFLENRRTRWVNAFGRLKPGATLVSAKESLQPFMHSMLEMEVREPAFRNASDIVRQEFLKCYIDLLPGSQGRSFLRQQLRAPLWVVMSIAGTVLLIACVNLANLLLARAAGREREVAVRLAVGAGRWRIVKQLLAESMLLAALGGAAGVAIAFAADKILLAAFVPTDLQGLKIYLANRDVGGMTVFVRTTADPNRMFSILRTKVRELDSNMPVFGMRTVEEDLTDTLITERMTANLSVVFGSLATLLAIIGLYGVMAYSVARRKREIGIRMALGALEGNVIWMVMKEVLVVVGLGIAIALPTAFGLTRLVQAQLYGVAPHDPWTMAMATIALTLVACAAGYIPALRASRADPIRALRYE